ncbi:uncharacterized protein LOC127653363 [Xyrauchen texanus]|uniref:uncharacterized protein LOC127653363 n=1 Tax=Xyrauchen texanus TaxID=154827 RepID=UPI002241C570|nr:uncharacterized protein LOC127653363 [Xyrauchen texanus]
MTRSFPALFGARGKRRHVQGPSNHSTPVKEIEVTFYLLPNIVERTPKGSEEVFHLQAGLGRRSTLIPENYTHDEVCSTLKDLYPKLESVSGGWLIYKGAGGWGSRKLYMVTPGDSGYTGLMLKTASIGGKGVLYIAPIQEELDTQPLPPDSRSFSSMPKAMCHSCHTSYPLQILALHVETCKPSDTYPQEPTEEDVFFVSSKTELQTVCPICGHNFPPNDLEAHASECGESKADFIPSTSKQKMSISSLDDVLQAISTAVNNEEEFPLTVSRSHVVERGLAQWKRQKKALPTSRLKIRFIGEAGLDTGALRKEFLTEMVAGIEQKLFEGDQTGKCPKYSLLDLDQAKFRSAGEIWAASLAQSGPPCCLKLWCYRYLCDGEIQIQHISKEDVSDAEYISLLSQVESATEATMTELIEDILSCGYNGPVNVEKREEILQYNCFFTMLILVKDVNIHVLIFYISLHIDIIFSSFYILVLLFFMPYFGCCPYSPSYVKV